MSKRIIITGATGFIGSAIVREFLNSGDEVIVLTRANSNLSRLESVRHSLQLVIYDSLIEENLIKSMMANRADVLVHCAWRGVAGDERNEAFQIYENIPTTIQPFAPY